MSSEARIRVSGQYAGAVTRLVAYAIDVALITALFALGLVSLSFALDLVSNVDIDLQEGDGLIWQVGFPLWAFFYNWVSLTLTGRTPGKAIVGLRVVCRDGSPVSAGRAFVRVVTFPLAFLLFGLGFVGILIDRERRGLYDLIAGTTVVYDWGERTAELPTPLSRWLSDHDADVPTETSSPAGPQSSS